MNSDAGLALPALVFMTDDERVPDPLPAANELPRGSMIVLRVRQPTLRADLAQKLYHIAKGRGMTLLIAEDPQLASRTGAHGVHFSERHLREAAHWRALRPHWLITVAAHSLRACASARAMDADAAFVSPVFVTQSHSGGRELGSARARLIAHQAPIPIYALGGIGFRNAAELSSANAAGLAAVSALKP